jgi:hypothetical protein
MAGSSTLLTASLIILLEGSEELFMELHGVLGLTYSIFRAVEEAAPIYVFVRL